MITKSIKELHEDLLNKKITSKELIDESLEKCHSIQDKTNAFVTIIDDAKESEVTDELVSGIPYGIKDNFSTKDILSTGSSNTLKDYVPFFDATAVANLKKKGAVGVTKTVLDELGMGGTGTTGHTGVVHNPWSLARMTAGSSAGSAASVASGCYPFALGSDTGDSIRKPAAYCGIVGYKPTYGMISRYGLFPFACSLDTVGVLSRSVEDAAIAVDAMKGIDSKDMTSWDSSNIELYKNLNKDVKGKKLFYIKEIVDLSNYENPSEELKSHLENFNKTVELCKSLGMTVDEVSIDKALLDAVPSVYVVISCAEATSNMSNLTGISFGPRGEGDSPAAIMKDHRTKGFSPLIKRRFVIGSYVLQKENQEKYFINAKRVRRMIVDKMNELFETYDGLILPVGSGPAKFIEGSKNALSSSNNILEDHLQIGNFGGFPSITIPNGFVSNLPVGVNITGKVKDDINVLNIAYALESKMEYKNQIAKEVL
ncbi:Asp-tRNA(Asn)/Glu-tRNA(Gln) amidotransferase subunit GatA [Holdemanella sp. SCCA2]|nr:Asp-tRNA(Asn)/Glu-tRNA(Gln) amidotransferase subunit GatA [Holdemanella sp. SCCA2]